MSAIDYTLKTFPKVWNQQFPESVLQPIQFEAAKRYRKYQLPTTLEEWEKIRPELYRKAADAMRLKVDHSLPLEYEEHGTIQLDGITIKKVSFCATPGRYMTANLYIPDGEGPFPAILHLHGHMQQGKISPKMQMRAQIFAKSGYVGLVVDAFGAGERTSKHPVPEYHGLYRGASVMNIGESLMGIQVADNMRAIDVLQSLPFVDKEKIGATGGSGGGNQTIYIAAMDDRVKAAVPVCSPATFEAYLHSTNCFCEVMPGGLNFTEEAGIFALTAPRALKLCSNINDVITSFSVEEMLRTAYEARKVYDAYGAGNKFQHEGFPGNHGYWPEVVESAVGFFDLHLKGIGNGAAHPVPDCASLPEPDLLVWEEGKAPAKLKGLKAWTNDRAAALAEKRKQNSDAAEVIQNLKKLLIDAKEIQIKSADKLPDADGWMRYSIDAGDVMIPVLFRKGQTDRCRILASDLDKANLFKSDIYQAAKDCTDSVLIFDPYGSGEMYDFKFSLSDKGDYHNLVRYCIWYGHSMLGIWAQEYNLLAQWAKETFGVSKFSYEGQRDAGAAAIFAAVLFGNADKVTAEKTVFSMNYVESVFSAEAATLALTVQDILLYADIANAIGLSNAEVKFIKPMHGDNTALSADEQAAFQDECNKETARFGMKTQLTIEG